MHPWEPEVTVDAGLASTLIDGQFPDLAGTRVHRRSAPSSESCTPPPLRPTPAAASPPTPCAATELRARAIAVNLAATLLAYAIDRGLPAVAAECRRALAAAVS